MRKDGMTLGIPEKKGIRRIVSLLFLLFCLMIPSTALAVTSIYDNAGIFSERQKQELLSELEKMEAVVKGSYFVLTTDRNYGTEASILAEQLFDAHANGNNGAVFVLDLDGRSYDLIGFDAVGYYLSDERYDAILDAAYERAVDGDYFGLMQVMTEKFYAYMKAGPANHYIYDEDTGKMIRLKVITPLELALAAGAALLCGGGTFLGVRSRYKAKNQGAAYAVDQNAKLSLSVRKDTLVNTFVTRRRIPKNTGKGPGMGGGGGSTSMHHTSGGHMATHGGGRKF